MKKIILSIAMLATVAFISCSDDKQVEESPCKSCEMSVLNIKTTTEYCDNGNGTYTIKVSLGGVSNSETLDFAEGQTIDSITAAQESAGATCK
ncbi:hypothetical protein PG911_02225 [Tenacibaculum ovolyticum]|uniref:hypothetical protein n=1 Tax=Tenacibaculum ovolyticum TaxID=104270 RepID=UPI000401F378|nr:hypothetical protein [Tenacibaculum ovolyticum]WBX77098.1 hypothetical protein PG911_02225 [Tenacibaculum ovolyticum]